MSLATQVAAGFAAVATAMNLKATKSQVNAITPTYVLAVSDPDPTTGSPTGFYFRRTT